MKLAILMTAFNGSNYIGEQIESLQAQTFSEWNLYIHDDCSTDDTKSIILSYADNDARIHLVSEGVKRGARDGFMWLLEKVDADYYMFSDHDDVWLQDKIKRSFDTMMAHPDVESLPLVVCTDLCVVDADLKIITPSLWKKQHVTQKSLNSKYLHLFYDNVTGCTMMLNRKAREVSLPCHECAIMHDAWIAEAVLWRGGKVVGIEEPLMLYRQHSDNVVGVPKMPSLTKQLSERKRLQEKTLRQYSVAREFVKMPRWLFSAIKVYYSMIIRITRA
ncbi:MAG: glycosyltransferase family 2 protein [Bacteroidaceae bacterium]|nr:glycosyltransferase family 2 protein [Bacteroidaceae bacterium]